MSMMGSSMIHRAGPLRGLRVLDFSRILAGPWCTMLLGDCGAHVIKVEKPGKGDDTRSWGPPFLSKHSGYISSSSSTAQSSSSFSDSVSTYFLSVNRSKQSAAVDLKRPEGQEICHRLATEWADVVVENFKVGTMDRMGLGYKDLCQQNPGLIYCSISGFGNTGPLCNRPGYDVVISGMYGLLSITGEEHSGPAKVGVAITDLLTGSLAQGGILAALHERHQTGRGQRVDTSLMETQLAGLVNIASSSLNAPPNSPPPKRRGTAHESIVPYQAFRCKSGDNDGGEGTYIVVGAGNDEQFQKLCRVLDLPLLATDKRFTTNADRVAHRAELIEILETKFLEMTRDEWVGLLEGQGFPMGPVRTVPESFQCKQAIHRNMIMELNHPVAGKVILPGSPVKYSGGIRNNNDGQEECSSNSFLPPPMLGEHTREILTNILNMKPSEIERLEQELVVESWKKQ